MKQQRKPGGSSRLIGRIILFALSAFGALNIAIFASTYFLGSRLPSADLASAQAQTAAGQAGRTGFRKSLHSSGKESIEPWVAKQLDADASGDNSAVKLLCKDLSDACESRRSSAGCNANISNDLASCKQSCDLCGVLSHALHAVTNLHVEATTEWPTPCDDSSPSCAELVEKDLCTHNPKLMLLKCRASCGFCSKEASSSSSSDCSDSIDLCPYLAAHLNLCHQPETSWWMASQCHGSCGGCEAKVKDISTLRHLVDPSDCSDFHASCAEWSVMGACKNNPAFMGVHCPRTCKLCRGQDGGGGGAAFIVAQVGIDKEGSPAVSQYYPLIAGQPQGATSKKCMDTNPGCQDWTTAGECVKNPSFMKLECVKSCAFCDSSIAGLATPGLGAPVITLHLPSPLTKVKLNNGQLMPLIGFGTAAMGSYTIEATKLALAAGYTHIDSAQAREWYREDLVGDALSGHNRSALFITSKIHPRHIGYRTTMKQFEQSLLDLKTDYLDLILLHYPACWGDLCKGSPLPTETFKDTWRAFEELMRLGKVRSIGVSNFGVQDLHELLSSAKVRPQVLQINVDPLNPNAALLAMCRKEGIQVVAYSTLGTQHPAIEPGHKNAVLFHRTILALSTATQRSPAQVTLRWALQMGVAVLPRSTNPDHQKESLRLYDFQLSSDQMMQINQMAAQH